MIFQHQHSVFMIMVSYFDQQLTVYIFMLNTKLGWFKNVYSASVVTVSWLSIGFSRVREIFVRANMTSSSIGWKDLQMVHQL